MIAPRYMAGEILMLGTRRSLLTFFMLPLVACAPLVKPANGEIDKDNKQGLQREAAQSLSECMPESKSTLDGVRIEFIDPSCGFSLSQAREGLTFRYRVIIEHPISEVMPIAQDDGRCGQPDESGLIIFGKIYSEQNNDWFSCRCDVGLCEPPRENFVALDEGVTTGKHHWNGRAGRGPSDYGASDGSFFPKGQYWIELSAKGAVRLDDGRTHSFEVNSRYQFRLDDH